LVADGVAGDSLLDTYSEERLPHSTGVVAHAVDTGRLIDRLAGRETEDPGIDSGYGGGRPFPHLEHGLRWGDHPAVGRQLPQPSIDGELLDERLGDWFAVIVDDPATVPDDLEGWAGPALPVVVPPGTLDGVLPAGGAVVVRPDRYVAAVADRGAALQRCLDDLGRRIGT
jgi:3-(3-hydroxy-phenyl)propionate hydroxylase